MHAENPIKATFIPSNESSLPKKGGLKQKKRTTKQQLEHERALAKKYRMTHAAKKRSNGYTIKSFYLRQSKELFDMLVAWLQNQEPESLKELIRLTEEYNMTAEQLCIACKNHRSRVKEREGCSTGYNKKEEFKFQKKRQRIGC